MERDEWATMTTVKRAATLPRGTVTFLLTDLQDSTRSWQADSGSMARAVARHYELVDEVVEACNGVRPEEQGEGDSVVVAFERPSDALAAAVQLQLALRREAWPGGLPIAARMSVHTGEALLRDESNYAGSSIIRAARVRSLAHGGQILVTGPTHDLVVDGLPAAWGFVDLGVHRLHNLDRPERVYQVAHPELPRGFPALASAVAARDLPAELTTFVGREEAIAEVEALVERDSLVTLSGAGGCGKTRLAIRVARRAARAFGDGAWWVDLGSLGDPALVPTVVRVALRLGADPDRTDEDRVVAHLLDRSVLLVLDNCEHLLDAVGGLVSELLDRCREVHVLTTSRVPLGLAGEVTWRVPSLTAGEARRLFTERAETVRGESPLTDADAPLIAALCERLDAMPLAIELAAARARIMSPAEILRGLDDRFALLRGGSRTAEPRQRTLRASLDWSYRLLGERERVVFARLAAFAGSCTLESAAAVVAGADAPARELVDTFADLVDKSMLSVRRGTQTRYFLLESVLEFARELLDEADDGESVRARHATWVAALVAQAEAGLEGPEQLAWLERFDAEIDNVRAAIEWVSDRDPAMYASIVTGCATAWSSRGLLHEAQAEFARLLQRDDVDPKVKARATAASSRIAYRAGDLTNAAALASDALEAARELGDDSTAARALFTLGAVTTFRSPTAARELLRDGERRARAAGDEPALIDLLQMVAWTYAFQEDHRSAAEVLDDVADLVERSSAERAVMQRTLRAFRLVRQGRFAEATAMVESAVGIAGELGDLWALTFALTVASQAASACGDNELYDSLLRHTLDEATETGAHLAEAAAAMSLAMVESNAGRADVARQILDDHQVRGSEDLVIGFMYDLVYAATSIMRGDFAAARREARSSIDYARAIESEFGVAFGMTIDAFALRFTGDLQAAESTAHEVLQIADDGQFAPTLVAALDLLAGIALERESHIEALRILAATGALREAGDMTITAFEAALRTADLDTIRREVGDAAYAEGWAEGSRLDARETIEYVTRARGERKRPSAGWDSLTPRELAVVQLAAEGLTNPEIAERLFVSRGTVKSHLASVFTKLGIRSRAQLAAEATRHGASP